MNDNARYRPRLYLFIVVLFWIALYVYSPYVATYGRSLGIADGFLGVILGSYGLTQMLFRLPFGIVSDMLRKRKPFVVLGSVLGFAGALGLGLFVHPAWLLVFRALSGASAACWVVYSILYTSYFDPAHSARSIGALNAMSGLGQLLGMLTGMVVSQRWGERNTFLVAAGVGLVGMLMAGFCIRENKEIVRQPPSWKDVLQVLKNRNLLWVSGLAAISQVMAFGTVNGFTPAFARETLGAQAWEVGLVAALATLPMVFASYLSAPFTRRFSAKTVVAVGFFINALTCLSIPFCPNMLWLYATQLVGGFARGLVFPVLMSQSIQDVPEEKRATAMGAYQSIYSIGMVLGPTILGFISDLVSRTTGFVVVSCFGALGCVLGLLVLGKKQNIRQA